jgi:DNA polymerase III epsilon subunit-like protein
MALFLDTETTGLSPRSGDTIVEVAFVDERGVAVMDTLVNPERLIPWQASKVHGISDSMVRGMPTLTDLMPTICRIVSGQQIVIYNATFDTPFFPGRLREASKIDCAMRRFAETTGGGAWRKLDVAAAHVGHVWSGHAHRACADALACRSVWNWLEAKASRRSSGASSTSSTFLSKVTECPRCRQKLRVPGGKLLDVTCPSCRKIFRLQS